MMRIVDWTYIDAWLLLWFHESILLSLLHVDRLPKKKRVDRLVRQDASDSIP